MSNMSEHERSIEMERLNFVIDFDHAVYFQGLGILQKSAFYWCYYSYNGFKKLHTKTTANREYRYHLKKYGDRSPFEIISAFSVGELGNMINDGDYTVKTEKGWKFFFQEKISSENYEREVDARAELIILMSKNIHKSVEQINERIFLEHKD